MVEWQPDDAFLRFLETEVRVGGERDEHKSGRIQERADFFMKQMRKGTDIGRELYANSYRVFKDRYEFYRSTRGNSGN